MTKNVGRLDQIIRTGISLGLIYVGIIDEKMIHDPLSSNIIGIIGALNLNVAIIRICPLYILTGIDTCSDEEK